MINLLSSELFRMRKRAQSWLLIAITFALTALIYGGFAIAAKVNSGPDAQNMRNNVTFESFHDMGLGVSIGFLGSLMLVIIAAGLMGNEFSWNTLRPLVARSQTRVSLLTAKIVAMVIYALIFVAILFIAVTGMYFIGSWFVGEPAGYSMSVFTDSLGFAAKLLYSNLPYVALAFMLATLFKSNAAGIAGALGLSFLEEPIWMLLGLASDAFKGAQDWGISANVNALSGFSAVDIGEGRAFVTLAVYALVFLGIAYAVFTRRDVTSG
ncbi:MAG: ABC transporter permease [Thermomicrobiales bacterium]|nr:ABC transporter permease [Thermomicrobiales bacterium]